MDSDPHAHSREQRDGGFSFTEVLVAIVLLGLTVTAVLVALRVTVRASVTDRDHASAFAWLQAASDEIYRTPRVSCTSGRPAALSAYDAAAKAVPKPPIWQGTGAQIDVIDVEYLGKPNVDADFEWSQTYCFEGVGYADSPLYTQRVTLQATNPNGRIVETIEMVKSD